MSHCMFLVEQEGWVSLAPGGGACVKIKQNTAELLGEAELEYFSSML